MDSGGGYGREGQGWSEKRRGMKKRGMKEEKLEIFFILIYLHSSQVYTKKY